MSRKLPGELEIVNIVGWSYEPGASEGSKDQPKYNRDRDH
jgi:hypothetical protein